jgi:hypothetical protein
MDAVLFTGAGYIVPQMIQPTIMGFVPNGWKTNPIAVWGVRAASVIVPSMLVRRFVSQRAGNYMLIGGFASFAIDAIKTFMPGVIPGLGTYHAMGMGSQPLLGAYFDRPTSKGVPYGRPARGLPQMIADSPDRLNPAGRF